MTVITRKKMKEEERAQKRRKAQENKGKIQNEQRT